uniref:Uncharacterized protein n=1 Tax=Anguilla anguilla TaxID=7936 RepID=A0A0E9XAY3_ANGAN
MHQGKINKVGGGKKIRLKQPAEDQKNAETEPQTASAGVDNFHTTHRALPLKGWGSISICP